MPSAVKEREFTVNYLMSDSRRASVRETARLVYLSTARRFKKPAMNKPDILRIAIGEVRQSLIESKQYSSVIGGLLLAIAMKMVAKLIEKWLEENLFTVEAVPPHFQKGEAGYVER